MAKGVDQGPQSWAEAEDGVTPAWPGPATLLPLFFPSSPRNRHPVPPRDGRGSRESPRCRGRKGKLRQGVGGSGGCSPQRAAELYLHRVLLVGDEVNAGLDSGVGPFSQHLLLQLVNIWQGRGGLSCWPRHSVGLSPLPGLSPNLGTPGGPLAPCQAGEDPRGDPRSPSNLPEKLSVALQRFFFLFLFLASGMSMG